MGTPPSHSIPPRILVFLELLRQICPTPRLLFRIMGRRFSLVRRERTSSPPILGVTMRCCPELLSLLPWLLVKLRYCDRQRHRVGRIPLRLVWTISTLSIRLTLAN